MNYSASPSKRETFDRLFPLLKGATSAAAPMIAADHLAHILKLPLIEVCRNGKLLAEGFLKARQLYDSDFIIVFADVSVESEAMGIKLEYFHNRNPQPVKHLAWNELEQVDMVSRGRLPQLLRAAEICREESDAGFPIFFSMKDPFSLAAMALGTETFLEKLLLDPDRITEALEICCSNQQQLIAAVISEGFIPFVGAPIASGGLIGAENFRRFALPYLERLFTEVDRKKSFRCLHVCGEIGMLTTELADLKLHLLSFEDWHPEMWNHLANTIPMGFVPTNLFRAGSAETVREATLSCRRILPEPYVLSTGCDLPANAKPELVQAMMNC
ncbi:hypothetical protein CEE37_12020 [candidate division LCP-89 bacterium B3_LCP]|uniref:Uroporphyrinogen decarboxylase (URO-D) domain-containing protein n=1 Tax=candidate division LCP-89 bacterium B3_LCP TaxID=2012998 RepID=A0A532UW25_UNCL8|nr:MAG: hypothetical protein CEE37_12020 [candidate division LCP-89 bacterium B3_LCP]